MNLSQIRYFVTAAQLQNLSKAAQLLHLSQPSLSKSISNLEEEIGTPLFDRNGKKIILNEQGRRFLEGSVRILRELDDAVSDIHEMAGGTIITVGIHEAESFIAKTLTDFSELHPEVRFQLDCSIPFKDSIDINAFDMLVYPKSSKFSRYSGISLTQDPYLLAVSSDHPLAKKELIHPSALADRSFVFFRSGTDHVEQPYRLCTALNLPIRAQCFTDSKTMHRHMVRYNHLLGFIPESCSADYASDPGISLVKISDPKFAREIMICFKREKHLSPLAKEFKKYVLEHLLRKEEKGC